MSSSAASRPTAGGAARAGRRRSVDGRRQLGLAVAMVVLGSFMPWLSTPVGNVLGIRGPGLWTFYAAVLGVAALVVPFRRFALTQGVLLAVVAVGLPLWQLARVFSLVGMEGWMPGPGLLLVLGGGVVAGAATRRMWRADWS